MSDHLSELPENVLCDIISSLTVRDAFRARSLSSRWKDLPDSRSVLQFDAWTILGRKEGFCSRYYNHFKFVKAVDQFFKIWIAPKAIALRIRFNHGNEYATHIDGWIARVIGKEVEELDFDFGHGDSPEQYVLPCHLLDAENGYGLRRLRLKYCHIALTLDSPKRWLSKLSTLELHRVWLCSSDVECILSNSLNLDSLTMVHCGLVENVYVQHPLLTKLVIIEFQACHNVELNCPHLETFELIGCTSIKFSNLPFLKEASLKYCHHYEGGCTKEFSDLAENTNQLQTLSLQVMTKVPPMPPSTTMRCLKRLDLLAIYVPQSFDVVTLTHLLHASPILEALHITVTYESLVHYQQPPERDYVDRPHFHLKEVHIESIVVLRGYSVDDLMEYLLRNGVNLEQMVLIVGPEYCPIVRSRPKFSMMQNINPTAQLITV